MKDAFQSNFPGGVLRDVPKIGPVLRLALAALILFPRPVNGILSDWEVRAREAFSRGDLESARRTAELALRDPASAAAAHQLLGHIRFGEKQNEDAVTHFEAAQAGGRSTLEMARDWSAALLALGRELAAQELLKKALSQDPSQTDLRYRLASSFSSQGKWVEAWPQWEKVYEQGVRHTGVVLQLARARFAAGQDIAAVELLKTFPAETAAADTLFEAGKLLFEKALYRQALEPLEKVWRKKTGAYDVGMYVALSHYLVEQYTQSERVLTSIQTGADPSSEYRLLLGSVRARLGKWDEARKELEGSVKRFPQRADGYLNLGLYYLERGDRVRARDLFDTASRLETKGSKILYAVRSRKNCGGLLPPTEATPTDAAPAELYSQLAEQLYARQQSGSALEVFLLALEADRRSEKAYAGIGKICMESDSIPEARAFLEQGLQLHPESASIHFNLGLVLQSLGQSNDAVREYRKAMELRGARSLPLDWIQLGTAQQANGNPKDAEASFLKGLSLDPALAQGHFELGKLYFQQANYDKAERALEKAIQLDPRLLGAYYQYGLVCMRNGKAERGKAFLNIFHQKKELYAAEIPAVEPPAGP